MKTHGKLDSNQQAIVKALRAYGCSVQSLADIGGGCPDILVGVRGMCWLFEIKDPAKPQSQRNLTEAQLKWHTAWRGQVTVIHTFQEALRVISSSERHTRRLNPG